MAILGLLVLGPTGFFILGYYTGSMHQTLATLVIGLGNPGSEYATTRHNAGCIVLDELVRHLQLSKTWELQRDCLSLTAPGWHLLKPQLYMNKSGEAVAQYLQFYKIPADHWQHRVVAYDDLDLPLGKWKLVYGSGPKVHNGLNSIIAGLGSDQFWHLRMGIDNRLPEARVRGDHYVLQPFLADEHKVLSRSLEEATKAIIALQQS